MIDISAKNLLQKLEHALFRQQQLAVQVLRLDRLHPVISGNKWLKLRPWITIAKAGGKTGLVTTGGPWSNHVHATAFAAKLESLEFLALIRGKKDSMTPMLEDVARWGGSITYAENENELDELEKTHTTGNAPFLVVPMGGEGAKGVSGVREFLDCLNLPGFDHVFCPVGTGTTLKGIAHSQLNFKTLHGINPGINDPALEKLALDLAATYPNRQFLIHRDQALKRFGRWPAFLPEHMNRCFEWWQVPADIVYTAKMFFIVMEMAGAAKFEKGSSILLVHTGGLQGNRSLPAGTLRF